MRPPRAAATRMTQVSPNSPLLTPPVNGDAAPRTTRATASDPPAHSSTGAVTLVAGVTGTAVRYRHHHCAAYKVSLPARRTGRKARQWRVRLGRHDVGEAAWSSTLTVIETGDIGVSAAAARSGREDPVPGWAPAELGDPAPSGLLETVFLRSAPRGRFLFGLVEHATHLVLAPQPTRAVSGPGGRTYRLALERVTSLEMLRVRRRGRALVGATLTYTDDADPTRLLALRYVCLPQSTRRLSPGAWPGEEHWRATAYLRRLLDQRTPRPDPPDDPAPATVWSHPSPR